MASLVIREYLTNLYKNMCDGSLQIPAPRTFDNSSEQFPDIIVGDEAVPLVENLLKPCGGPLLSFARGYIESTFGWKWRIFHRPFDVDIDMVECSTQFCQNKGWSRNAR